MTISDGKGSTVIIVDQADLTKRPPLRTGARQEGRHRKLEKPPTLLSVPASRTARRAVVVGIERRFTPVARVIVTVAPQACTLSPSALPLNTTLVRVVLDRPRVTSVATHTAVRIIPIGIDAPRFTTVDFPVRASTLQTIYSLIAWLVGSALISAHTTVIIRIDANFTSVVQEPVTVRKVLHALHRARAVHTFEQRASLIVERRTDDAAGSAVVAVRQEVHLAAEARERARRIPRRTLVGRAILGEPARGLGRIRVGRRERRGSRLDLLGDGDAFSAAAEEGRQRNEDEQWRNAARDASGHLEPVGEGKGQGRKSDGRDRMSG